MLEQARVTRLKGNIFARPDWFKTNVATGVARNPGGERICTLSSDFILGFCDGMAYECGPAYLSVLKSTGRRWGTQFIHRLDKTVREHFANPIRDLQRGLQTTILADAFAEHGWGRLRVIWDRWPGLLGVEIENPIYPDLILQAEVPSDPLFAGFTQSIFEFLLETQLDSLQTDCPTREASASRFILGQPATIADLATRHSKILGQEGTLQSLLRDE